MVTFTLTIVYISVLYDFIMNKLIYFNMSYKS